MACSDLWAIHQRKYKEQQKGGFLVAHGAMKSLLVGTWVLTFAECTTIMIVELVDTRGLESSLDYMVLDMV
jgi:hypothetical protein